MPIPANHSCCFHRIPVVTGFILSVLMLIGTGCHMDTISGFRRANETAALNWLTQFQASPRFSGLQQVWVMPFGTNGEDVAMRQAMHGVLTRHTDRQIIARESIDRILKAQNLELFYSSEYKKGTLVKLGQIIGARTLVIGKVIDRNYQFRQFSTRAHIQVWDLQTGTIIWEQENQGKWQAPITPIEISICIMILLTVVFSIRIATRYINSLEGPGPIHRTRRKWLYTMAGLGYTAIVGIFLFSG